jgi:hypothetical protein
MTATAPAGGPDALLEDLPAGVATIPAESSER